MAIEERFTAICNGCNADLRAEFTHLPMRNKKAVYKAMVLSDWGTVYKEEEAHYCSGCFNTLDRIIDNKKES